MMPDFTYCYLAASCCLFSSVPWSTPLCQRGQTKYYVFRQGKEREGGTECSDFSPFQAALARKLGLMEAASLLVSSRPRPLSVVAVRDRNDGLRQVPWLITVTHVNQRWTMVKVRKRIWPLWQLSTKNFLMMSKGTQHGRRWRWPLLTLTAVFDFGHRQLVDWVSVWL